MSIARALSALSVPLICLLASPLASAQSTMYCCNDGAGRRVCSDSLPQICYDRAYREVSPGGRVVREIEAPMTAAQRAKRDEELKEEKEKIARAAEAKRRDQALLESYGKVSEIEGRRDREIGGIEIELRNAKVRETELLTNRTKLDKLKPASGPVPRELTDDLSVNTAELNSIRSVIDSKQRDIDLIRSRFEADRKRYLELTQPTAEASDKTLR